MVKKSTNKELIKRLNKLQCMANRKSSEPVLVNIEKWLESNDEGTFNDYIEKMLKNKSANVTLIIDDMSLQTDLYIPSDLIYLADKSIVKEFVKAANETDEMQFMKLYVKLFEDLFDDTCTDVFLESKLPFYKDFLQHYKVLSFEELIARYKTQKFFKMTMCNTSETQKQL